MLGDIDYAALGFETFHDEVLMPLVVVDRLPLRVEAHQCTDHITPEQVASRTFEPVETGFRWGPVWSTCWFRVMGQVPENLKDEQVTLHFSSGTEALLWRNGTPSHGLDPYHHHAELGRIGTGEVELLIEAACNRPLGASMFWWEHHEEHGRWKEANPGRLDHAELQVRNELAERFARTWLFATRLMRTGTPRTDIAYRIEDGLRALRAELLSETDITIDTARMDRLEALLHDGVKRPSTCTVAGHAHIDTAWLWPISETRRKCLRTFATQLENIRRHPSFRFLCSQPQQYAYVEEDSPELFARIREQVEAGRWEPAGAMWIEPDANIPSGESLIRQILHGTRYWKDRFGDAAPQEFLYLPDTFGFPACLPQICRLAGLKTFITNKIAWSETNRFPHVTFNWRGLDGTEVLTHFTPGHNYNSSIMPQDFVDAEERLLEHDGTRSDRWLQPYGWGDGGGGPDEEQIMNAELASKARGMPKVEFTSVTEFCRALHDDFTTDDPPPAWDGELYLELHRGTYTTHARLKASNRKAERDLREIEILATAPEASDREVVGELGPWLDRTWKTVLLNQFHDIIPGSSISPVYEDAHRELDAVHVDCDHHLKEGLRRLEGRLDTRTHSRPVLVWNPSSTNRSGVVETDAGPVRAPDVPALGIRIIDLAADQPSIDPVVASEHELSNGMIHVRLDEIGRICALRSVVDDVEFNDPLNTLVIHPDRPRRWEAWDLDRDYTDARIPQTDSMVEMELVEAHPLRGVIEVRRNVGVGSRLLQRYVLEAGSRVIRIENVIDWNEDQAILRAEFAPTIRARRATYGTQFGSIERPTHENTSWEKAAFEVPGHLWMDLSEPGRGIAVIDDGSRFGRSCRDGVIGLSLVRATSFPDPGADRGRHEFAYGLMPHAGDWRRAGVDAEAEAFGMRLRSTPAPAGASGRISDGWSALPSFRNELGVEVSACKPAEEGEGMLLRLVERRGARGSVRFELPEGVTDARLVDLHERPMDDQGLLLEDGTIEVFFGPHQIRSILMV